MDSRTIAAGGIKPGHHIRVGDVYVRVTEVRWVPPWLLVTHTCGVERLRIGKAMQVLA